MRQREGSVRPLRVGGQQTAEFALLMGIAAMAAIGMQFVVRNAIRGGLGGTSDTVLGRLSSSASTSIPTPNPSPEVCTDPLRVSARNPLCVTTAAATDEIGGPGLRGPQRTSVLSISGVRGHSFNEDVRLRTLPSAGITEEGESDEPGQEQ